MSKAAQYLGYSPDSVKRECTRKQLAWEWHFRNEESILHNDTSLKGVIISIRQGALNYLKAGLCSADSASGVGACMGCSSLDLVRWVEQHFLPGMTWENRDKWVLSRYLPLSLSRNLRDAYLLAHYTNIRPSWYSGRITTLDCFPGTGLPKSLPEDIHPQLRAFWERRRQLKP